MKSLISLLVFFTSLNAFAKGIACEPNPHEAQFMISWSEKEVTIKVINPMGYSFMPQMEAVGESSIPFLKMQTDDLKGLGDSFEYHWTRENCTIDATDEWLIECHGNSKAVDPTNKISSLGFTTAKLEEKSLNGNQTTYRNRIVFDAGNIYFVTIPSNMNFCRRF